LKGCEDCKAIDNLHQSAKFGQDSLKYCGEIAILKFLTRSQHI